MKVLITGADGMLGASICREALKQGYEVRALVLPGSSYKSIQGLSLEVFYGDLLDKESLALAIDSCDALINVAASTQIWPRRSDMLFRVNYQAVVDLVELSKNHGLTRFIQIGTANSFGHGTPEFPGNEESPFMGNSYKMDYVDSKYQAQKLLLEEAEKGFPALIINPTYMIGPFDSGPSSGRMILALIEGKLPGFTSGMKNFVASKDVAVAAVNALTLGHPGSCFIAGNVNLTFEEMFKSVCRVKNIPFKLKRVPDGVIYAVGFFISVVARITGKPPKLGYHMAKQATMQQCYNPAKARTILNMPSTPIEQAIEDCLTWWKENQYIQ
ncbi:MAG: NAD-dependent epimerase/dehydratase family protein [Flavobacteriia bacterium]|nr:NAD-dependent epimerase/dehydratase family protein [Flavobacteriia bacterium]